MSDPPPQTDLPPDVQDDAIIGKAFKGSAFVLAGIIVIGLGIYAWKNRTPEKPEEQLHRDTGEILESSTGPGPAPINRWTSTMPPPSLEH